MALADPPVTKWNGACRNCKNTLLSCLMPILVLENVVSMLFCTYFIHIYFLPSNVSFNTSNDYFGYCSLQTKTVPVRKSSGLFRVWRFASCDPLSVKTHNIFLQMQPTAQACDLFFIFFFGGGILLMGGLCQVKVCCTKILSNLVLIYFLLS